MRLARAAAALAVVGILAACGKTPTLTAAVTSSPATTTTTATPSPTSSTPQPGPVAFVAWAKTASLGDRDPSAASDEVLLNVGNRACDVLVTQPSFGQAVQVMVEELKETHITAADMDAWFRAAVVNLCPQHKDLLP